MKLLLPSAAGALALALAACGDGKADAAKKMAAAADSTRMAAMVDLSAHHMPLMLEMPDGLPGPALLWKDEIGKLSVRAGDRFALDIHEAPADLGRLKADLDRDLLKRNTIVEETPDLLIYRSEFPDDTALVSFHFNRSITVGDRTFQVEDAPDDGAFFTLDQIKRMAAAVRPKPAA